MRLIDADALKERIRKALGIKSFDNLLPSEKTIVKQIDMASTIHYVVNEVLKMMTLEEAIEHCEEVAKITCGECAKEHLQLAEWLRELKQRREQDQT